MTRRAALPALLALALVASTLGAGPAAAAAAGEPALAVSLDSGVVVPGEETTLSVAVANGGGLDQAALSHPSLDERVTTARSVEVSMDDGDAPIDVRTPRQVRGSLPGGATTTLGFDVRVAPDAAAGTYRVPVEVEYTYTDYVSELTGFASDRTETERFTVRVRVERRAKLALVETTSDVTVGQRGVVNVTVENVGPEAANETRLALTSLNGDLGVGAAASGSRYLGRVAPGERRAVSYAVSATPDARAQAYAFELAPTFEDADGRTVQGESRSVGVTPRPDLAFGVGDVSTDLRVGRRGDLRGSVTNRGDRTARNAVVVVESAARSVRLSEARYPVGDLSAGGSASFSLDAAVPASADAGPRQFVAHVEYEAADGTVLSSDPLRFAATVGPERDRLELAPVNATFAPDTDNRLVVRVRNVGETPLTDLRATIAPGPPFESQAPESYVPALAPGESTTVAFELTVSDDAVENTHAVPVNVTAETDAGDAVASGPHLVAVRVAPEQGAASDTSLLAGAALLVVAVLAAGWWWLRH